MHAADEEIGISRAIVPTSLTNDRSATGLANAANAVASFGDAIAILPQIGTGTNIMTLCNGTVQPARQINPIAYTLFNYKLPNGQYLIPSANPNSVRQSRSLQLKSGRPIRSSRAFPEDAEIPGEAVFLADQGVADLDWNPNSTHSFSAKYYYQHDPTTAPYAFSMYRRLSAASRRGQPGDFAQPYADCQIQPEHHRNFWLHSGKSL